MDPEAAPGAPTGGRSSLPESAQSGAAEQRMDPGAQKESATFRGQLLALTLAAGAVTVVALNGGSYDVVDRHELGILAWWILGIGLLLGLFPRSRPPSWALAPAAVLAALGVWTVLGLTWTDSSERTLAEVSRIVTYLGVFLLVTASVRRSTWRPAAAGLAAGALLVGCLATTSRLFPEAFPDDPVEGVAGSRLSYPFDYWNAVGAWGAMAVMAGLAWSLSAVRPVARAAYLAAVPAAALSIYLSYSRAAIVGLAVGLLCLLALLRPRLLTVLHVLIAGTVTGVLILITRSQPELAQGTGNAGNVTVAFAIVAGAATCGAAALVLVRVRASERWRVPASASRRAAMIVGAVLVLVGIGLGPGLARDAWESFRDPSLAPQQSADPVGRLGDLHGTRHAAWSSAVASFRREPWHGSGAGTFEFAWNRDARSPEFLRDAHSIFLEPLGELGLPGAILTVVFLASGLWLGHRVLARTRRRQARGAAIALLTVYAVFIVQAGVDWMWESTAVALLALAGVAALTGRLGPMHGGSPRAPLPVRGAAAVASLGMCVVLVPGLVSTSLVRESQQSVRDGSLAEAREQAADAVAIAPWAASPRMQSALVHEASGSLAAARADLMHAAQQEPLNWRVPLLLARVEAKLERPEAALRQFRQARKLRPRAAAFAAFAQP